MNGPPVTVEHVIGRLNNWKFSQARRFVREIRQTAGRSDYPTDEVCRLVGALADTFGDVGGFDGSLSTIVQAATARAIDLLNGKGAPSP